MNSAILAQFSATAEEKEQLRKINDDTSSEDQRGQQLKLSGTFIMEVDTGYFYKKDKTLVLLPDLMPSSKGSLMMIIRLKVCDGIFKDHTVLTNIVFHPKKGSDAEVVRKIFSMAKPRIAALVGTDDIHLDDVNWCIQNMGAEWDLSGKNPVLVRDHKMKSRVKVIIEDDLDQNGKDTLKVKSIFRALPTDVSVPNEESGPKQAAEEGHTFQGQAAADKPVDVSAFADDDVISTTSETFEG